jgi:soluble lytic murein transglycosylase-like protein
VAHLALALLLLSSAAGAEVFSYVDEKGATHYTNVPWERSRGAYLPAIRNSATRERYRHLIHEAARDFELNPVLIHAVILVESAYKPEAVSHKGAVGLMQLMPMTARRYKVRDVRDPAQNIRAGAQYLRDLLAMFDQDLPRALAAYNAGEEAVLRHGGIPPYPETRQYVAKVLQHYQQLSTGRW